MNLYTPLIPWKHQETIYFNGNEFFLETILAKGSILDVWQSSKYTNEYCCSKILGGWLLMSTGKYRNKGLQEGLCYVFMNSFHLVFSVWFFNATAVFFIFFIIFCYLFYRYSYCQESMLSLWQIIDRVPNFPLIILQRLFLPRIVFKNCFSWELQ